VHQASRPFSLSPSLPPLHDSHRSSSGGVRPVRRVPPREERCLLVLADFEPEGRLYEEMPVRLGEEAAAPSERNSASACVGSRARAA